MGSAAVFNKVALRLYFENDWLPRFAGFAATAPYLSGALLPSSFPTTAHIIQLYLQRAMPSNTFTWMFRPPKLPILRQVLDTSTPPPNSCRMSDLHFGQSIYPSLCLRLLCATLNPTFIPGTCSVTKFIAESSPALSQSFYEARFTFQVDVFGPETCIYARIPAIVVERVFPRALKAFDGGCGGFAHLSTSSMLDPVSHTISIN